MKPKVKISQWKMRCSSEDKKNISKLAEQLGVNDSVAVRCAVEFALESGLTLRAIPTKQPSGKWKKAGAND